MGSDFDGFLNWHEHIAGTNQYDANSTPGLDFGLIAHWTFDETHGTLGDSSGNDVNGTLHGIENGWTAGRVGGALRFDGVDDYVSFPGQTQLDDIRPFSFSGWIKLDDNGSGYVLAKRSSTTGYWRFSVNNNMTWLVRKGTLSTPLLPTIIVRPIFPGNILPFHGADILEIPIFESTITGSSFPMPPKWGEGNGYPMPIICSLLAIVRRVILPILRDGWMTFVSTERLSLLKWRICIPPHRKPMPPFPVRLLTTAPFPVRSSSGPLMKMEPRYGIKSYPVARALTPLIFPRVMPMI